MATPKTPYILLRGKLNSNSPAATILKNDGKEPEGYTFLRMNDELNMEEWVVVDQLAKYKKVLGVI